MMGEGCDKDWGLSQKFGQFKLNSYGFNGIGFYGVDILD
jgi:hypothetical protein